jgi:hypothetical protein
MTHYESFPHNHLTFLQDVALSAICERYSVAYQPEHYINRPMDGLPDGYVSGFVGGWEIQKEHPTIYIGVSPEGHISS